MVAHNRYQQRGGEDIVYEQEAKMLAEAGCVVQKFSVNNDHINGTVAKVAAVRSSISNKKSVDAINAALDSFAPDVVHFHNFFPTLSPAAVRAALGRDVPVFVTLHNYRMICPGSLLMRENSICEDCVGHSKLSGIRHGCYRGSIAGTSVVAAIGVYFKSLSHRYACELNLIALTDFAKARFVADGYRSDSIAVRGNFISDPGAGAPTRDRRIVYVGRLSVEKGLPTLLEAAKTFNGLVEIVGDGPERERLETSAPPNVIFRGLLEREAALERIKSAAALVLPSAWYEGFPIVLIEAMATGTPVLVSKIGALPKIIADGEAGKSIAIGDVRSWSAAMQSICDDPISAKVFGERAREIYLERYSPLPAKESLLELYRLGQARLKARASILG